MAALIWIPQAALVSLAVQNILDGIPLDRWWAYLLIFLGLGWARGGLDAWGQRLCFKQARNALSSLRDRSLRALLHHSPLDKHRLPSGQAASLLTEQAESLLPYLSKFQPIRLRVMVVPLAIAFIVLSQTWIAALILLIAAPLIPLFMALVGQRTKRAAEEQMVEMGDMNAFLLDRLRGLATLRALSAIPYTATQFLDRSDRLRQRIMAVLKIAFLSSAVLEFFASLGVAMVAVYIGFHLLGDVPYGAWGKQLTLGQGLFVLMLAPAFFEPLRELSTAWHDRASGQAALAGLQATLEPGLPLQGDPLITPASPSRHQSPPGIALEQLHFAYPSPKPDSSEVQPSSTAHPVPLEKQSATQSWERLNLIIQPGEKVALFGPSGSGKSTLLALLAGLIQPLSGTIQVDGHPLQGTHADHIRQRTAWLAQQTHIFHGSLADNIALGRPFDEAALKRSLQQAQLDTVYAQHGDQQLAEGGQGISGGEKLRLALARALIDPSKDLILIDEPTAHLDAKTAHGLTEQILRFSKERTVIVATHDRYLAQKMDRIILMDDLLNSVVTEHD